MPEAPVKPPTERVTFTSSPSPRPPLQAVPTPLVKKIELKSTSPLKIILIGLAIVLLGVGSGYGLNLLTSGTAGLKSTESVAKTGVKVGDVVGSSDEKSFRDQATGVLERGGIDGEGSHRLLREGGPDQTAYLTSSVVDLDLFVGHKVQVWGETFSAQKAGWLMDVGRIKALELNAPKPFEEKE